FIDVYHRTGLYPVSTPFTPGGEGAGIVDAIGVDVDEFKPGDRVAYASTEPGAYAEMDVVHASKLIKIPDGFGSMRAAAILLQGLTVHYLVRSTHFIREGETVLIHAAAGGVGSGLVQIAKHLGAFVIGTVSTAEKAKIAKEAGADEAILYTEQDFH